MSELSKTQRKALKLLNDGYVVYLFGRRGNYLWKRDGDVIGVSLRTILALHSNRYIETQAIYSRMSKYIVSDVGRAALRAVLP